MPQRLLLRLHVQQTAANFHGTPEQIKTSIALCPFQFENVRKAASLIQSLRFRWYFVQFFPFKKKINTHISCFTRKVWYSLNELPHTLSPSDKTKCVGMGSPKCDVNYMYVTSHTHKHWRKLFIRLICTRDVHSTVMNHNTTKLGFECCGDMCACVWAPHVHASPLLSHRTL